MTKLEGITKLRGKIVELGNIGNSILRRVLHLRLRNDKFNFWHGDYSDYSYDQHNESSRPYDDAPSTHHTDFHKDTYNEGHKDNHTDKTRGYIDTGGSHPDYMESSRYNDHTDKGHSDQVSYGYDQHTDIR